MNSAELHLYLFVKLHDRNDVPSGFWIIGYFCMKNSSAMVVFKVVILQLFSREIKLCSLMIKRPNNAPMNKIGAWTNFPARKIISICLQGKPTLKISRCIIPCNGDRVLRFENCSSRGHWSMDDFKKSSTSLMIVQNYFLVMANSSIVVLIINVFVFLQW